MPLYQRVFHGLRPYLTLLLAAIVLVSGMAHAANEINTAEDPALDVALQTLKKEVLSLNRDLFILEEELMFPANTQVAVYLSLDIGEFFALDSVTLKVNNREVASHLYTERQLDALSRGGVQRLFLGNLRSGEHELMAVFTGRGPNGRDYRRATSLEFSKDSNAKKLELVISDEKKTYQPDFSVVEWQ